VNARQRRTKWRTISSIACHDGFTLHDLVPLLESGLGWYRAIDTSLSDPGDFTKPGREIPLKPADQYIANPRSTVILLAQRSRVARRPGVIELVAEDILNPSV
jgi:hypothetical protein